MATETKPRVPIAAMFSGPGPSKYLLPGSTGQRQHDRRYNVAPAYSFGGRAAKLTSDCSPGPKYGLPEGWNRFGPEGSSKYSLHYRARDMTAFRTPGPGNYANEEDNALHYKAPAYSFGGRSKGFQRDTTPAANAYHLPSVFGGRSPVKNTAPCYSQKGRSGIGGFSEDLSKTPGPGAYKTIQPDSYKYKQPLYSMIGRNTMPGDATRKPGPGAHSPERVYMNKMKAPDFSFGTKHSDYEAPLIVAVADD